MSKLTKIDGRTYEVFMPRNPWDMNFHFEEADHEFLVDLQDVCDFVGREGASINDAIKYAKALAADNVDWYWKAQAI